MQLVRSYVNAHKVQGVKPCQLLLKSPVAKNTGTLLEI